MTVISYRKKRESVEQCAYFTWLNLSPLPCRAHAFAIPNGGTRHQLEAYNLKKQGVKPGVSDVFVAYPAHGFYGLWLEFKVNKNKLTPLQKDWLHEMRSQGYAAYVVYSWAEAIKITKDYCDGRCECQSIP